MLQQTLETVREPAPAKINLALHVTGRRADGYHLLETLAVFTELGDRLAFEDQDADRLAAEGHFGSGLPLSGDNLVAKARDRLRKACPDAGERPVSILLEKHLPIAGGIGGGSSDAAATLRGLTRLWRLPADGTELARIGVSIGADVPMCLAARPLIARGIGEELEPVAGFPELHLVLVNPGVAVPTPDAFRALGKRDNPPLPPLPRQIDFDALCGWLAATRNDLERPALSLQPVVGDALREVRDAGAAFARMSGSGATCYGLFETAEAAESAAAMIRTKRGSWFVKATRTMASGA